MNGESNDGYDLQHFTSIDTRLLYAYVCLESKSTHRVSERERAAIVYLFVESELICTASA